MTKLWANASGVHLFTDGLNNVGKLQGVYNVQKLFPKSERAALAVFSSGPELGVTWANIEDFSEETAVAGIVPAEAIKALQSNEALTKGKNAVGTEKITDPLKIKDRLQFYSWLDKATPDQKKDLLTAMGTIIMSDKKTFGRFLTWIGGWSQARG